MHDGMPYDPIHSKVKVTRPSKLEILQFSKSISYGIFNVSWQMTTDSETMEQYQILYGPDFRYLSYFFCHLTTNLEQNLD